MNPLPYILAFITGYDRYKVKAGVNFEWSNKSWTHNVFRSYEIVFGRKWGIRAELSTGWDKNGNQLFYCHSWESAFAVTETLIREWLNAQKPSFVRLYTPVMATNNGFQLPSSPFLFAIATDSTASGTYGASPRTHSHICTGSDLILMMSGFSFGSGTTSTYNGTSMTNLGAYTYGSTIRYGCLNYLISPSTGSNTLSFSPGGDGIAVTSSYSGVSSTGQPDAAINTQTTGTGSAASLTATVTVTASGSWLMAGTICEGNALTAGTGATLRITGSNVAVAFFDSNGAPGTGSQSMTVNESPASQLAMGMVSIAPVPLLTTSYIGSMLMMFQ